MLTSYFFTIKHNLDLVSTTPVFFKEIWCVLLQENRNYQKKKI